MPCMRTCAVSPLPGKWRSLIRPQPLQIGSHLVRVEKLLLRSAFVEVALALVFQLDALGELQLQAGLYQDACATINQIITLHPNDVEQYQNLLSQLGC